MPQDELVKYDGQKILEFISNSNLSKSDKQELTKKIMENDAQVINTWQSKMADSNAAQRDISNYLNELRELNKAGMYATTKLEAKTGSGKIEMQFKGGDTRLIIPVLAIIAVVLIAVLFIFFYR